MQLSTYSITILLLLLLVGCSRANFLALATNPLADTICALANCGQGTCKASSNSLLGYECECYAGWKKVQIGPLTFPPCIVPDCTLNFDCGEANPSPAPPATPPFNLSDPCSLTWCGYGTCIANGTGYACKCNANSANLLNLTSLPCLRECNFGADCQDLGFGPKLPDPPSPSWAPPPSPRFSDSSPPPTPSSLDSSSEVLNHSRIQHGVILLLLAATLLAKI